MRHQLTIKDGSEIQEVHTKLKSNKSTSVQVNRRSFFQEVCEKTDAEIVEFFLGYKWRAIPSTRLIPKRHIEFWRQLPSELRRVANSFHVETQIPRVSIAYNKLKHGPQLVLQNPLDRARHFGRSPDVATQMARYDSFDKLGVRLLFAGARTQFKPTDGNLGSIAPFLVDDEEAVNQLFFGTMVHQANLFNIFVKMHIALYRKARINIEILDKGISRIVEAHGRRLSDK